MRFLIFLLFISFLCSCSKPEENLVKIPSEFSVSVIEDIKSIENSRSVWLEFSSMNTAYCEEDTLSYLIIPSGDILSIEISDSYQPHTCFQKTSFLKTRILLPQFNDSLPLKLNLGSASIIQFTVFKNSSDYNIEINNGIGLINKFEKTERIPDNLIWGYAYPKILGAEGTLRMNDFIREVQGYCYTARLSPGFYSYFTLSDKNELILNENPGITGNFSNFFYLNFEPKESLQQYFDNLASKYYNLVGYKITTGTGKEFKSN